ncbi:MAG: BamA/OMP85 family outer membrane protein, partial [Opitutaceae bacterium]
MKTTPNDLLRGVLTLLLFVSLALAGSVDGKAQMVPDTPGAGYKVGKITIKFVGTANVNAQVVRANMQLHEGSDLDDAVLDHDIRNLYNTGLFEFIQTKWQRVSDRVFNLVVEVTPKYRILAIRYEGNHRVKTHVLRKQVKSRPDTALDERNRDTGFGTIVFVISEGPRIKIKAIDFVGNAHIKSSTLRHQMDTKRYWMLSWITSGGRFKEDTFEDDLDKLRDYYRDDGFLDVDISEDRVLFRHPKPGELVIVIPVNEGRQYRIGQITFSGNRIHSSALLHRVIRQKPGMIFSPSKLDSDVERLSDFYGKDGYLYTDVRLERQPNLETDNIDIEYRIDEGDRYNVESI